MPDIIDDFEFEICLRGSVEKLRMGGGRPERCVWGVKAEKIDDLTTNFKITSTPEGVFINALNNGVLRI